MKQELTKVRDFWFDNAKAFLIILVVVGHMATGEYSPESETLKNIGKFIYWFHMPVFMIISGRFSRGRVERGEYAKAISSLLIPYLILHVCMLLLYSAGGVDIPDSTFLKPRFGLWYFLALFIFVAATISLKKYRLLFPVSVVVALGVSFLPEPLFGVFQRVCTFYPFFLFGYFTSSSSFHFCRKPLFRLTSFLFLAMLLILTMLYGSEISLDLLYLDDTLPQIDINYPILQLLLRYVIGFLSFFAVMGIIPAKKTFFSYIGTHSVYVYALHLFILQGIEEFVPNLTLPNMWWKAAYLCCGIVLPFLLASTPVRRVFRFVLEPSSRIQEILENILSPGKHAKSP